VADRPKVLASVEGRPFLTHLLDYLLEHGFTTCVLCVAFQAETVIDTLGERYGALALRYAREIEPAGTAGALVRARPLLTTPHALVFNGDTLCRVDLRALASRHVEAGVSATMVLSSRMAPGQYGHAALDPDGYVTAFGESGANGTRLISAGIYAFTSAAIAGFPSGHPLSLERDILPDLARRRSLRGYVVDVPFHDIGTPERYAGTAEYLREARR
jgi:NDP-sugar pyrophosphorylase family protein